MAEKIHRPQVLAYHGEGERPVEAQREGMLLYSDEQEVWSSDLVSASLLVLDILALAVLCCGHRPGRGHGSARCLQKINSVGTISDSYHISDRHDGSDDEQSTTRTYPSRTSWGAAYSLGEKFPFLLERKFGIAAYDYWYGYSSCQIDLMLIDQPVIDYGSSEKKSEKSMFGTREEYDEMEALVDAWEAQNSESMVGKKVDLNEFMKKKV